MFRTTIASVMLFTAFAVSTTVNAATHPEMQVKPTAQTASVKANDDAKIVVAGREDRRVDTKSPKG
ncbi:hypothetical protein SIAM614_00792 [Stappia aggregata IAM 12614]|uniref:Uncharacterized protein n=1 Tax=Roseibium aggregatum (strain ATCC 25650 / DSM 13394 / JCM 20685 / NBRC 16684 / NCIMB 2208 / IAM 12614 / B1) TaxID=384765 RepID=A0P2N6_ROSAI|nr:hypothetical protein [Roseibium aggregatum]EAV40689.1 hypothetical protein SIAM614_00567 [Stappia aggregata IAM 12614] [Roseibium aggregatum IAM 12614]EAV40734.1 hypothetical protein SIAM614_00792 [Stappia aggregata IAM 12614] [Roseibium aggregatum IAM 12614]